MHVLCFIFNTDKSLFPGIAYERALAQPAQQVATDAKTRQELYARSCRERNVALLRGRDAYLKEGIVIRDWEILNKENYRIPIRSYNSISAEERMNQDDAVIYYHGGGLYVGDLDSEDLTCRRICKDVGCNVYSVDYRLMTDFTADDAFDDAMTAFLGIIQLQKIRKLLLMGSSSGGQLAAMVSQEYQHNRPPSLRDINVHGVLLRGPVTCDATEDGTSLPPQFKEYHTSMSTAFHTSLLSSPAVNADNRVGRPMPLEGHLSGLPRHWIQVSTNDIYYSDGVLYAEALRHVGVEVELDIVAGWPHTFWLKAPELERAVQAEQEMIIGIRWLFEAKVCDGRAKYQETMEAL